MKEMLWVLLWLFVNPAIAILRGLPSPTVTTPSGRLRGKYVVTRGGRLIEAYLGIPFAKPPVGSLRFQPPQPVEPWTHERLAVTQPLACAQIVDPTSVEDCLYLNVYIPNSLYLEVEANSGYLWPFVAVVIEPECVEDRLVTGNPWDYNVTIPWLLGVNSKEYLFILAMNDMGYEMLWILLWLLMNPATTISQGLPSPIVTTPSGRLIGKYEVTRGGRLIEAYLGIPFAKPPVGPLRFQPPQPVEPWTHERLAITQPLACAQIKDPTSVEDCLYLNVYTPDVKPELPYPVLVFVPGGSFEQGSASIYTPEYFLDKDIVLVILQYRLGLFGFLSTGDEVVPGNMGLKDQRLALRWLQDNVRSFGGDPDRVTIYGESAGGSCVHYLLLFSAHEGLFWAGIVSSVTALMTVAFHPPKEVEFMKSALADFSGCPSDSERFVECLRARPTEEILLLYDLQYKALFAEVEANTGQLWPYIGGVIEAECVEDRLVTGNPWDYNVTIPWLLGVNSKEFLFFLAAELQDRSGTLFTTLNTQFDSYFPVLLNYQSSAANGTLVPLAVREFYLDLLPISRLTLAPFVDAVSDAGFIYITYEAVLRADRECTYLYYFDYQSGTKPNPVPIDARVGVPHAEDLFYLFSHPGTGLPLGPVPSDPMDMRVSTAMVDFWTNFATCRNPTPPCSSEVLWKSFSQEHNFFNISQTTMKTESPFLPERMAFWQSQPFPFRDDNFETPACRSTGVECTSLHTAD